MDEFRQLLLVATGGAIGSVARWRLSGWVLHQAVDWRFPIGAQRRGGHGGLAGRIPPGGRTRSLIPSLCLKVKTEATRMRAITHRAHQTDPYNDLHRGRPQATPGAGPPPNEEPS